MLRHKKEIFSLLLVMIFFITASFLAHEYSPLIRLAIEAQGGFGIAAYILINIVAVVVAPISAVPLLPFAVAAWGSLLAAILSIASWTIGAAIAFLLARKYGQPLTERLIRMEKIRNFENLISSKNLFWTIVLLRMVLPVDVLSYALGLFSSVKFGSYFLATLIGVTPFALIFAYSLKLPLLYEAAVLALAFSAVLWGLKKAKII